MEKLPENEKNTLSITKTRLQTKIMIITPAIDLIELISARGNTSLDSTLELTKELKEDIDDFEKKVDELNDRIVQLAAEGGTVSKSKETAQAAQSVEDYMKNLLFRIEEAIPLISLALTTSGANLSSRLPDSVSPGRLLQAANHVTTADNAFVSNNRKKLIQVGPTFTLKMYTIFYGTARNPHATNSGDITWKEEHAKCQVSIHRVPTSPSIPPDGKERTRADYKYQLAIDEDLDDGRYHEKEELDDGGRSRTIDVSCVTRLFFSASGRLLEIDEAKTPVLVLKLNTVFEKADEHDPKYGSIEWLAFEQHDEEELEFEDEDDLEEEKEDDDDEAYRTPASSSTTLSESAPAPPDLLADKMSNLSLNANSELPSLSLLEYLLRLTALQENDQASMYNIHDERISLYLRDEGAAASSSEADASPRASPQQLNHGSPASLQVSQAYNRTNYNNSSSSGRSKSRSIASPKTPTSSAKSQSKASNKTSPKTMPLTPWEQDRLHNNPALRKALAMDYVESPLKGKQSKRHPPSSKNNDTEES